jgi:hypothetical protein
VKWGKILLAVFAALLAAACSVQTDPTSDQTPDPTPVLTGSIGVRETQARNWLISVDGSVAGTVAANSSTVIDKVKPGVHLVGGSTPPGYIVPEQWITVIAGQTVWVNF